MSAMNRTLVHAIRSYVVVIITATCLAGGRASSDEFELQEGQRFEIVGTLYAHGVRDDLGSDRTSIISAVPLRLSGPEIVFRQLIPRGSILTIVGKAPGGFFHFLYPTRYIVRISSVEAPVGVPVVIDLSRGIEGKSKRLNESIFKPLP